MPSLRFFVSNLTIPLTVILVTHVHHCSPHRTASQAAASTGVAQMWKRGRDKIDLDGETNNDTYSSESGEEEQQQSKKVKRSRLLPLLQALPRIYRTFVRRLGSSPTKCPHPRVLLRIVI